MKRQFRHGSPWSSLSMLGAGPSLTPSVRTIILRDDRPSAPDRLGRPVTPSDARVGYRRTGDASRSFLCLGASVGKYPADSGREGSPGRDRASSLAQLWIDALSAMTSFS